MPVMSVASAASSWKILLTSEPLKRTSSFKSSASAAVKVAENVNVNRFPVPLMVTVHLEPASSPRPIIRAQASNMAPANSGSDWAVVGLILLWTSTVHTTSPCAGVGMGVGVSTRPVGRAVGRGDGTVGAGVTTKGPSSMALSEFPLAISTPSLEIVHVRSVSSD